MFHQKVEINIDFRNIYDEPTARIWGMSLVSFSDYFGQIMDRV